MEIFGNNKPKFTTHFLERYAERIFHVEQKRAQSWIKCNSKKFYSDLFTRLEKSKLFEDEKFYYVKLKYGPDVKYLKAGNYIFVVRNYKEIVTFMKDIT